jgi:hypothetical protein
MHCCAVPVSVYKLSNRRITVKINRINASIAALFLILVATAATQTKEGFFGTSTFEFDRPQDWAIRQQGEAFMVIQRSTDVLVNSDGEAVVRRGALIGSTSLRSHEDAKGLVRSLYPRYKQSGPDYRDMSWRRIGPVTTSKFSSPGMFPGELSLSTIPMNGGSLLLVLFIFDAPTESVDGVKESGEKYTEMRTAIIDSFRKPQK